MFLVSIAIQDHDASICIMENEKVLLFIQEERISRIKHDASLPLEILNYIPHYTKNIDYLCLINYKFEKNKDYILNFLELNGIKVHEIIADNDNHHLFHASSAFYGSGFEESACLVIDGLGSNISVSDDTFAKETTSIYTSNYPCNFKPVYKSFVTNKDSVPIEKYQHIRDKFKCKIDLNGHMDIGMMYGAVTSYIGFSHTDQGKTMGLSSYGKENEKIPNLFIKGENNSKTIFESNMNLFNKEKITLNDDQFPFLKKMDFQEKADLCYKLQKSLEKIFLERVQFIVDETNCKNLVFSGGCALNILGNSIIKHSFPKLNFYIDPIANDGCQSFGACQFYYHKITNDTKVKKMDSIYLGLHYNKDEYSNQIKKSIMNIKRKPIYK